MKKKTNTKHQVPNNVELPKANVRNTFVWNLGYWNLGFVCNLVFVIWCLFLSACTSADIFPSVGNYLANPSHIVIDSANDRGYLVNSNNKVLYDTGSLQVLDLTNPAAPELLDTIELDSFSGHGYLDAASGYLYLTNRLSSDNTDTNDNILRVNVDEASDDYLKVERFSDGLNPFGLAFDVSTTNVYLADSQSKLSYFTLGDPAEMKRLNLQDLEISDGSTLANSDFRDIAIIGRQAFISRTWGGVLVYDLDEDNVDYYISDITTPRAIITDGTNVYVTTVEIESGSSKPYLLVLDPVVVPPVADNSEAALMDKDDDEILISKVEVGVNPQEITISTDYIFVSNMDDNTVSAIAKADYAVTEIEVGEEPFGMGLYSPGGVDAYLYVTNIQSNTVSIIDLSDLSVVNNY